MKHEEFLKIIGILLVSFFIIYIFMKMLKLSTSNQYSMIEGMTNNTGEAGTSASYAAAIKSQVVKLQDELLISKYRKDYESAIINLDDYAGYLMLKQILNIKLDGDMKTNVETLNNINILKEAKDSLNAAMTFLDKQ
jgi:hypothetical protein